MANMNLLNIQTFVFQVWSVPSRLQVPACVFVFAPALLSKTHLALLCFFRARGLCATTWRFVGRSLALSTSLSPSLSTSLLFLSHTTCCNRRLSSLQRIDWSDLQSQMKISNPVFNTKASFSPYGISQLSFRGWPIHCSDHFCNIGWLIHIMLDLLISSKYFWCCSFQMAGLSSTHHQMMLKSQRLKTFSKNNPVCFVK